MLVHLSRAHNQIALLLSRSRSFSLNIFVFIFILGAKIFWPAFWQATQKQNTKRRRRRNSWIGLRTRSLWRLKQACVPLFINRCIIVVICEHKLLFAKQAFKLEQQQQLSTIQSQASWFVGRCLAHKKGFFWYLTTGVGRNLSRPNTNYENHQVLVCPNI